MTNKKLFAQNHKGIEALNYAEKADFDDEEVEKKDLAHMMSVYGILRKLDIDWKKGCPFNHKSIT